MDFILDILTRSWILSWISSKVLPELARSWKILQDLCKIFARFLQDLTRSLQDPGRSGKSLTRSWQDIQDLERWDNNKN